MIGLRKFFAILHTAEKRAFFWVLTVGIISALVQMVSVVAVLPFISLATDYEHTVDHPIVEWIQTQFYFSSPESLLIFSGIVVIILLLLSNALAATATFLMVRFAYNTNHSISNKLLISYLYQPFHFFLSHTSSQLSSTVLNEVNQLTSNFIVPLQNCIVKGMVCTAISTVLFILHPLASIMAFGVFSSTYVLLFLRFNRKLKKLGFRRLARNRERYRLVQEAFLGIKELKIYRREHQYLEWYRTISSQIIQDQSYVTIVSRIPRYVLESLAFGGILTFVLVLTASGKNSAEVLSVTGMFAYAGYRLIPAVQELFQAASQMRYSDAVLDRIHADLLRNPSSKIYSSATNAEKKSFLTFSNQKFASKDELVNKGSSKTINFKHSIRLEHVSYTYPGALEPAISDISLEILHGQSVAFVGSTGSGKTTIIDLIMGLLAPEMGEIRIDDMKLVENNLSSWQNLIGYASQHVFLFDASVAANIAFSGYNNEIDMNSVHQAATLAAIKEVIEKLPHMYDETLGERGLCLSSGQRQRIGIARALYRKTPVLIFDEATNALDSITVQKIVNSLGLTKGGDNASKSQGLSRNRTLIIVSHRLTSVRSCDVIFLLEMGKIVDRGTYDELYHRSQLFRSMAKGTDL